jgi:hypothetical protein
MQNLGEFFKKIGGIQAQETLFRTGVQSAVKEHAHLELPLGSISFKSGIVTLKVSHMTKSVIFTRKAVIIESSNKLQTVHKVSDIR